MKRITTILIFAVMFLNMFAGLAFAEPAPSVTVGGAEGEKGESVEIPVSLANNSGFSSLGIEVGYDKTALKLTKVTENSTVGATFTKAQTLDVNPYNMSWDSVSNVSFNGTLVTLTFEIITDNAGEYPVTVDFYKGRNGNYKDGSSINYDENFNPLGLAYVNGKVSVVGNVKPDNEKPTVTVGGAEGEKGESVEIPVSLANNIGFSSLGIEVGYDKTALKLTKVTENSTVGATFTKAQTLDVNPYNMSWDSVSNVSFNGTLVTLTFEIITDNVGEYPVTVDFYKGRDGNYKDGSSINYDENFNPLGLKYVSGGVTVTEKAEPSISAGEDLKVTLTGDTSKGKIYAAVYGSDNKVKATKIYPAADTVNVSFDADVTGSYVKIMWWNDNLQPVCKPIIVSKK